MTLTDFIGIAEFSQESMDKLALLLGKPKRVVPTLNVSPRDGQVAELSPEAIEEFKARNALDYKIYNHCLDRFRAM